VSEPTLPPETPPAGDQPPVRAPFRPAAPQPFEPGGPPAAGGGGGCAKPALIGCGVVFLLLGVGAVAFLFKARDFVVWTLERAKSGIEQNLAPEVTAEDRARFDAAFASAVQAIRGDKLDTAALQTLQTRLLRSVEKAPGTKISRDELLDLTEAFAALERTTPPAGEASPSPAAPPNGPPG